MNPSAGTLQSTALKAKEVGRGELGPKEKRGNSPRNPKDIHLLPG